MSLLSVPAGITQNEAFASPLLVDMSRVNDRDRRYRR